MLVYVVSVKESRSLSGLYVMQATACNRHQYGEIEKSWCFLHFSGSHSDPLSRLCQIPPFTGPPHWPYNPLSVLWYACSKAPLPRSLLVETDASVHVCLTGRSGDSGRKRYTPPGPLRMSCSLCSLSMAAQSSLSPRRPYPLKCQKARLGFQKPLPSIKTG